MNVISEEKKAVDELVSDLKILPQILKNEGVTNKIAIMENPELKQLIQKIQKELGEKGRIVVRPSGTEQLIRVMVEAETLEICEKYVESVISLVKELSF
ncbi:Phosphoglucosamine mutase [bioreactor metagenome]|uniref:Phosphoglucosamine mutase n=1 Tax=bioreactor metagenome TaxID=1076179 RepID=A0A645FXN6_9ZZZZ